MNLANYSSLSIEELLRRCSADVDGGAWEEFVRRFHRLIAKVVLRVSVRLGDSSRQTVDDLIQETYFKFCADNYRLIREFQHRQADAFVGFVQVVAANVVRDYFKSSGTKKRGANRVDGLAEDFVPVAEEGSSGSPKAIERAILLAEVERCLAACVTGPDRERNSNVFWLYYRAGLSASAIAALPGMELTTKGVESLILRLTREMRQRMAPTPARKLGKSLTGSEGILPAESF